MKNNNHKWRYRIIRKFCLFPYTIEMEMGDRKTIWLKYAYIIEQYTPINSIWEWRAKSFTDKQSYLLFLQYMQYHNNYPAASHAEGSNTKALGQLSRRR